MDSKDLSAYPYLIQVVTILNTLSTVLVVWVIMLHSPMSMRTYKYFLLNVAVSTSIILVIPSNMEL